MISSVRPSAKSLLFGSDPRFVNGSTAIDGGWAFGQKHGGRRTTHDEHGHGDADGEPSAPRGRAHVDRARRRQDAGLLGERGERRAERFRTVVAPGRRRIDGPFDRRHDRVGQARGTRREARRACLPRAPRGRPRASVPRRDTGRSPAERAGRRDCRCPTDAWPGVRRRSPARRTAACRRRSRTGRSPAAPRSRSPSAAAGRRDRASRCGFSRPGGAGRRDARRRARLRAPAAIRTTRSTSNGPCSRSSSSSVGP